VAEKKLKKKHDDCGSTSIEKKGVFVLGYIASGTAAPVAGG
jgi:hypothetical protein